MKEWRARLTLCSALLLAALGEPVLAHPSAADPPTMMFVEFRQPAKFVGFPKICPGSSPEESQEEQLCLAELYQGPAERLRHLSGPKTARMMRLRTTAHSAYVVLRPGTLLLVAARPFEDQGTSGIFAYWWTRADENGRFCLSEADIAELGLTRYWGRAKLWVEDGPYMKEPVRRRCLKP